MINALTHSVCPFKKEKKKLMLHQKCSQRQNEADGWEEIPEADRRSERVAAYQTDLKVQSKLFIQLLVR